MSQIFKKKIMSKEGIYISVWLAYYASYYRHPTLELEAYDWSSIESRYV